MTVHGDDSGDIGVVTDLFVYPIKGLSGQRLADVYVTRRGFPFDRLMALARRDGNYSNVADQPLSEASFREFYAQNRDQRLAGIETEFDPLTERLVVKVQQHTILDCMVNTPEGVEAMTGLLGRILDLEPEDRPVLARACADNNFGWPGLEDRKNTWACHVVNLASLRDLENTIGQPIDPRRFRANIYLDLGEPWVERQWVGRTFSAGEVNFQCFQSSVRCAVTEVNPDTAQRDIPLPRLLKQHYGHTEFGFYANILTPGHLRPGMPVRMPSRPEEHVESVVD